MTNRCIFQVAFLLCLSATALSISYSDLQRHQIDSSLACQELLTPLKIKLLPCLNNRKAFKIPREMKHPLQLQLQKEDAAFLISMMLQNILTIFENDFSSTGWNETIVGSLFAELTKQIDDLKTFLEENSEEESLTSKNIKMVSQLKSYYWKIQMYLKHKGYSKCAWMVVRDEIYSNFSIINELLVNLRTEDTSASVSENGQ